jgi:tetratricopeptide (TPR) repeat protein
MRKSSEYKRIYILFIFSFVVVFQLFAQAVLVRNAELANINGNFKEAIKYYKTLIQENYKSDELFYNLANSYFKENDFGHAVLYYEKALKIAPNNEAVLKNLKIARKKIDSPIEEIPELIPIQFIKSISKFLSPNLWSVCALLSIILVLILIFFKWIREKKIKPIIIYSSLILTIFVSLYAIFSNIYAIDRSYAIILKGKISFVSPSQKSEILYDLLTGEKIKIIDSIDLWYEIELINKEKAWIQKGNIERI